MAVLEEHNSCLEEGKRSTESSLPLLGVEDTHMWEPRSGHGAPLDGEPLLEEYSLLYSKVWGGKPDCACNAKFEQREK